MERVQILSTMDVDALLEQNTGDVLVEQEAVDTILDALEGMTVLLDADPISGGPTRLQEKMAKVRNFLSQVQLWHHIVSRSDHSLNRVLLVTNAEFDLREKDLIANDPDVRGAGSSHKDREAMAHYKMRDLLKKKFKLEAAAADTSSLLKAINTKKADLKDTVSRLRDQMSLCKDELTLGRFWGSQVPESDVKIQPHPKLTPKIEQNPDVVLADLLGIDELPSRESFKLVDVAASLEADEALSGDKAEKVESDESSFAVDSEMEDFLAQLHSPLPGDPVSPVSAPEVPMEMPALATLAPTTVAGDAALDLLSMSDLDDFLDTPEVVVPPILASDGLPDDFWDGM